MNCSRLPTLQRQGIIMGLAVELFGTLALGFNGVRGRLKPVNYLGRWGGLAPLKSLLQTTAGNVEIRRLGVWGW